MTAKRPNKPQRLSGTKNSGNFCSIDYNSAPLAVKTVGGALILPPATLAQAGTPDRKPWRSDQGSPCKKSARPRRTRTDRLRPCLDQDRPHEGPRSPQTGAPAAGYASPTATGTAHRGPRGTPYAHASETETSHNAKGRAHGERKINPG